MNASQRTGEPVSRSFAAASDSVNGARSFVTTYVRASGGSDEAITRAELIASELVSNAIEATSAPDYVVSVWHTDHEFTIAVTNEPGESSVPMPRDWHPESVLSPKGRGLLIVRRLAKRIEVEQDERAITVIAYLDR